MPTKKRASCYCGKRAFTCAICVEGGSSLGDAYACWAGSCVYFSLRFSAAVRSGRILLSTMHTMALTAMGELSRY